jgi:WD40 repeat protein
MAEAHQPPDHGVVRVRGLVDWAGPQPDYVPPFWSERAYGVARGHWDPKNSRLKGSTISPSRVLEIEHAVRAAAHKRAPPMVAASTHLLSLLAARDEGGAPNYGKTAVKGVLQQFPHVGTVSVSNFTKVLRRKLHVDLVRDEVVGVFKLYGHTDKGLLPYKVFVRRLFGGDAKAAAKKGHRVGAYIHDQRGSWDWSGMIRYPQCKNGVYPPSDWPLRAAHTCALSKQAPSAFLNIEFLYGYACGWAPNLFYNKHGDLVYYAAGVGVVMDDNKHRQHFFLRHDDDIECLCLHPDKETVATGQFGTEPSVWIWSSGVVGKRSKRRGADGGAEGQDEVGEGGAAVLPLKLTLPRGERSVIACGFSGWLSQFEEGELLATVSTDYQHTLRVWDWKRGAIIEGMKTNAYSGDPPAVFGVRWNPYKDAVRYPNGHACDFCTWGRKHLSFWAMGRGELEKTGSSFGDFTIQDVLDVCFLPNGHVLTAGPNGAITVTAGATAIAEVAAHALNCRCIKLREAAPEEGEEGPRLTVLSGGGDARVRSWALSDARTGQPLSYGEVVEGVPFELLPAQPAEDYDLSEGALARPSPDWPPQRGRGDEPEIVALDCDPEPPYNFIVGTADNDIWEVDEDPSVIIEGQSGPVYGLAPHPSQDHIYASGSEDGNVYIWDARRRKCLHSLPVVRMDDHMDEEPDPELRVGDGYSAGERLKVRAVEWSHDGEQLLVTTCGVVGSADDDDLGGVIQIYAVDPGVWFAEGAPGEPLQREQPGYSAERLMRASQLWETKDCNAVIDDVKMTPDGQYLAAACHDSQIYVYKLSKEFAPVQHGDEVGKTSPHAHAKRLEQARKARAKTLQHAASDKLEAALAQMAKAEKGMASGERLLRQKQLELLKAQEERDVAATELVEALNASGETDLATKLITELGFSNTDQLALAEKLDIELQKDFDVVAEGVWRPRYVPPTEKRGPLLVKAEAVAAKQKRAVDKAQEVCGTVRLAQKGAKSALSEATLSLDEALAGLRDVLGMVDAARAADVYWMDDSEVKRLRERAHAAYDGLQTRVQRGEWHPLEASGGKPPGAGQRLHSARFALAGVCRGHSSYVTHIDWDEKGQILMSNSGDYEILYWDVRGKRERKMHIPLLLPARVTELGCEAKDLRWASWTSTLGFPVMGIWQDGECGNDINSCHRSRVRRKSPADDTSGDHAGATQAYDEHFLVTSGDDGLVRLFNYPCVVKEAPNHAFKGHSAFTENVRFLSGARRVVSAGGGDRCVIQWKTYGIVDDIPEKLRVGDPQNRFAGSQQAQARAKIAEAGELMKLQHAADGNEAELLRHDAEIARLRHKLALRSVGAHPPLRKGRQGAAGRPLTPSVSSLKRMASVDETSSDGMLALDHRKVQTEFRRIARGPSGRRGQLRLPGFKLLLKRIGWKDGGALAQQLFQAFDKDKNGEVSLDEMQGGLALLASSSGGRSAAASKVELMFSMMDSDGNGTIDVDELQLFVGGVLTLTSDAIELVLRAIEGMLPWTDDDELLGSRAGAVAAAQSHQREAFRFKLRRSVETLLRQRRERLVERAMAAADVDNDGAVTLPEWQQFCAQEPQLLRWMDRLGSYWTSVARGEGLVVEGGGARQLQAMALQSFLGAQLRGLRLEALTEALRRTPSRLDAAGCAGLLASLGVRNPKLAEVLFGASALVVVSAAPFSVSAFHAAAPMEEGGGGEGARDCCGLGWIWW